MSRWSHRAHLGLLVSAALFGATAQAEIPTVDNDPYRWLENIDGEKSLDWVKEQNARTREALTADPRFEALKADALSVLNSGSRLPGISQRGEWIYNLWRDDEHPRGVYRRVKVADFGKDDAEWQTVLDIDALSKKEDSKWVFSGMNCLPPEYQHCLAMLSPGGGDATVMREFDMSKLDFVEDGFKLPKSKMQVSWRDADSLYVGTDFGDGSMTSSGYPRIVKLWERGEPLAKADTIFEGKDDSVWVGANRVRSDAGNIDVVVHATSFWTNDYYQLRDGELSKLNIPESAVFNDAYQGRMLLSLKQDWTINGETFEQGSVVIVDPALLRGEEGKIETVIAPTETTVIQSVSAVGDALLVSVLDDVRGRLYRMHMADGGWQRELIEFPENGTLSIAATDSKSGDAFIKYEDFLTPPTLYHVAADSTEPRKVMAQSPSFDASKFEVAQHFTKSADGTRVPYFVVKPKGLKLDGSHPTHIFSYGGFRNSLTPSYSGSYEQLYGAYGKLWLERGGVFVLANIRGGGEYGPSWHQAALKENHYKAFEDFEAVARDLIDRGVTTSDKLGIEGRSNGGLLVTAAITREPNLYGAVVCGVPLTDMKRYNKLLAGASWMGEYGNPDKPEEWEYIKEYSPYHNLEADVDYPPVFFYTSTRDDRVHPGHARKMAAAMLSQDQEVYLYENLEGGHKGSTTNEQLAYRLALAYTHLWRELGE